MKSSRLVSRRVRIRYDAEASLDMASLQLHKWILTPPICRARIEVRHVTGKWKCVDMQKLSVTRRVGSHDGEPSRRSQMTGVNLRRRTQVAVFTAAGLGKYT